jgi:hypothetical protein
MRVVFSPPSQKVWESYFRTRAIQYGHGTELGTFRGRQFQRGHGLGNILGSLFKKILPAATKVGKTVGKELLKTSAHVASDALAGRDLVESLEQRSKQGASKLLTKGLKHIEKSPTTTASSVVTKQKKLKGKKKIHKGRGLGFMPKRIKGGKRPRRLIRRKVKIEDQLGSYYR